MEQHFLTAPEKLAALVYAAHIGSGDRVLELGSGGGTVAAALPACTLTLVELDSRLAQGLRVRFPEATVLSEDALGVLERHEADVILSNLPHTLTEGVLRRLGSKTFRRALIAAHENDDVQQLARVAQGLSLKLLLTLNGDDFSPPQPFKSHLILATPHAACVD
ncbi:MAG: hypothetical protein AVDCRST_MAG86-2753 [uncultured Truepera sp.]|uniref:Ribosomal RNA adenine methylase transferase N-terminal domain-containing protein n=1 Tax=uncultured Truepera sp. TaxID=543023 RepID=A0A6J4VR13_9DEIN|nr:MAG: hypothetical protein AVDCRST_MAG86-2753 [uncultured Truepera sp.]